MTSSVVGSTELRADERLDRLAAKRQLAAQRGVERDAERILVGTRIDVAERELLGRHVRRSAGHQTAARHQAIADHRALVNGGLLRLDDVVGARARETEVDDPRLTGRVDEHVVRLEVAMDEARRVGGHQPATRRQERVDELAPRATTAEPLRERRSVDPLHHDEHAAELAVARASRRRELVGPDVVDDDDVGVLHPRERSRLVRHRPPLGLRGGVVGVRRIDELDRDLSLELRIERREHDPESARAEPLAEPIARDVGWRRRSPEQRGLERSEQPRIVDRILGPRTRGQRLEDVRGADLRHRFTVSPLPRTQLSGSRRGLRSTPR
jgi:hypothetical protein